MMVNHFEHHEDGKQLYVYRNGTYQKDAETEKFLGQSGAGWKIHLNVPADKKHALTSEIASFLNAHPFVRHYKIGMGGDEELGSGMTIYVGSWDRVAVLAHTLHEVFGTRLPPARNTQDMRLVGNIVARFDAQSFKNTIGKLKYQKYGSTNALAPFNLSYNETIALAYNFPQDLKPKVRQALGKMMIESYIVDFGDYLLGTGNMNRYAEGNREIAALPKWAQCWVVDARVPFDLETARPQPTDPPLRPAQRGATRDKRKTL